MAIGRSFKRIKAFPGRRKEYVTVLENDRE